MTDQATVSFYPPIDTGGEPITGYTVTAMPGGITASGPSSPITVTGLTDGVQYTFTVTAMNAAGTSMPSAPSNPVTPSTVPGAPTAVQAFNNQGAVQVFFESPANGGSVITEYTATSSPGAFTASSGTSPITYNALALGTAYTFTVVAVNANGAGAPSAPSSPVTPSTVPSAPVIGAAVGFFGYATVAFTPGASNGAPITNYTAISSPGSITATGTMSPITVPGLTNGIAYTFSVAATNLNGTSVYSAASNAVVPQLPTTVPGAPTAVVATPENAAASVAFTAPTNGGAAISSYTVTASPGGAGATGAGSPITVSGLTNGTAYTFTVVATNSIGTGQPSAPSPAVTPAAVPGAPTSVAAIAGVKSASVAFSAPTNTGGAPISTYTVTASPGGGSASGAQGPLTVTNLTAEIAYTFTVTATNAMGTGPPSAPSSAVTPYTVPAAPTGVTATGAPSQASIAFAAPTDTGGAPIFNYLVASSQGGAPASGAASPIIVTGLTNGEPYTFTVKAQNAAGTGASSAPSNSVTPATVPGTPAPVSAMAGNAQATVTFGAAASGGSVITSYTATASPGGASATGAASPLTVTGLTNGTAYTFTVTATNAVGTGAASASSNPVTPSPSVPSAPTSPSAIAGNAQATVSFNAPSSTGGSPITGYTVLSSGGQSASAANSPIVVTGLTNGTSYTFTVTATNAAGTGPASTPTAAIIPSGPPLAPTAIIATAGNSQVSVAFTAANANGAMITGYTVTSSGGQIALGNASPIVVTGLTNGTSYTFTVTATNANGVSPASQVSNAVTPATVPGAPTSPSATAGNKQATVSFTAPASNGGATITSYIVTSSAGQTASGTASPITITSLTNGTSYTFTVVAVNAMGKGPASAATVAVTPFAPTPFAITTSALPSGATGVSYSAQLAAANGIIPYTYVNTTALPAGLSLSSSGALTGTPTGSGTITAGFQATDSTGAKTAVASIPITIVSAGGYTGVIARSATLNQLVNSNGTVVQLRGANFSGLEDSTAQGYQPWYGSAPNWTYWQTWKPNAVRLPLNAAAFLGLSCRQINSAGNAWSTAATSADPFGNYVAAVDAAIAGAQAVGCYVILDLHWSAPQFTFAGATAYAMPLFQPPFMNSNTDLAFWQAIATRYGTQAAAQTGINNSGIIFELFNEPYLDQINGNSNASATWNLMKNGGTQSSFSTNGATTAVAQTWTVEGYQTVLNAIRAIGAHNVLAIGGCGYSHAVSGYATYFPVDTLSPSQVVATAHWYPNGTYPYSDGDVYPLVYPDPNSGNASWDTYAKQVLTAGIPLLITEDGGTYGPSATSGEPHVSYETNWADTNGASYIGWEAWAPVSPTANGTNNLFTTTPSPTTGQGQTQYNWMVNHAGATTVPSSPTNLSATASNQQATVSFTPPSNTGGAAITSYKVTSSPGAISATGTASPITVTGLTDGTSYTFTATAANTVGTSAASAPSNAVTPTSSGSASAPTQVQMLLQGQTTQNQATDAGGNNRFQPQNANYTLIGWQAVSGATSYKIYRATIPVGSQATTLTYSSYSTITAASSASVYSAYASASQGAPVQTAVNCAFADTAATGCVNGTRGGGSGSTPTAGDLWAATGYSYKVSAVVSGVESALSAAHYAVFIENGLQIMQLNSFNNQPAVLNSTAAGTDPLGNSKAIVWTSSASPYWNPYCGNGATEWNLNVRAFNYIEMYVKAAQNDGNSLTNAFENEGDNLINNGVGVNFSTYSTPSGNLTSGVWTLVKQPLSVMMTDSVRGRQNAFYKCIPSVNGMSGTWYIGAWRFVT